ncbi:CopD family protein [Nitrosomonas sp.]|uniref:CopD family protein n=1 Tax=Nitrosomonas sp. TaxID=42353 RepID=UPI001D2CCAAC|nr:CopD family protein [Nitrosomonas sp.]MCB1949749.1 CopD family protein [Nitrosomonas sp.]MCP5243765.1 CopD family protein [Burkholderiales bacterium]MCP5292840.1 CopD family protein [Burkholderiales bacterium]MDR4515091.1 CopD family protein [Nitrosomonas sp.]
METLKVLHILGVVIWVGGMFFAYMVLRPVVNQLLPSPPQMLKFWQTVFASFFHWVWLSITVILASGLHMIAQMGGFKALPFNVYLMFAIGSMMILIFLYVYFTAYRKLKRYVAAEEWESAGIALVQIRVLVGLNLILGFVTIAIAILDA